MPDREFEVRIGGWKGKKERKTTGRFLVLLGTNDPKEAKRALSKAAGISSIMTASDFPGGAVDTKQVSASSAVFLDSLGVAAVWTEPDQNKKLTTAIHSGPPIIAVEAERYLYAAEFDSPPSQWDESSVTWGLQAVRAVDSRYSGNGVSVAILDTGIDPSHPDMGSRVDQSNSFVPDQSVDDANGHGTHCAGTACGPRVPTNPARYGVAYNASLWVGKVLNDEGEGKELELLAGVDWAVRNRCAIVSLSLCARMDLNEGYSTVFEGVAQRALDQGTIIIAATGNHSARSHKYIAPVGHPACCPSVVGVAAIDKQFKVADFSNGSVGQGGEVNIAAPGVEVLSSWLSSDTPPYARAEGTSMATPHVAGVLALIAEKVPEATGKELRDHLLSHVRALPALQRADVGAGLVQAP